MKKVKIGVIGLGYWGPNYVRNFVRHKECQVVWACDLLKKNLEKIHQLYPQIKPTYDYKDLLEDKTLDCIALATPTATHFKLAKSVLEKNKHLLIPKPLTKTAAEAETLIKLAKKRGKLLMADLTFLYTGAIREMKKIVSKGKIGMPLYYDSTRVNLGLIQSDSNVIWDLTPHDFSIIDYCFGFKPQTIFAIGSKHLSTKFEEMAHITIGYKNGFTAHIHVSWLSPVKLRTIMIGGSKKMILFDDVVVKTLVEYEEGKVLLQAFESSSKLSQTICFPSICFMCESLVKTMIDNVTTKLYYFLCALSGMRRRIRETSETTVYRSKRHVKYSPIHCIFQYLMKDSIISRSAGSQSEPLENKRLSLWPISTLPMKRRK